MEITMTTLANAAFAIASWDEKPYDEMEGGPKLTRASVVKAFTGDIEGEGKLEYLMVYRTGDSASFVGLERVKGRVGERSGSFVFLHRGTFEGTVAKDTWVVVPGSGTGDLRGLRGEVHFAAGHAASYAVTMDYHFE
jgi:hypothetical protein